MDTPVQVAPPSPLEIKLLTNTELAKVLHVSTVTLWEWRRKGKGPQFTRLGNKIFYPAESVHQWIRENMAPRKVQPNPPPQPTT